MTDFETALDNCLQRLGRGEPVEACLQRYPEQAAELKPLLEAAGRVRRGQKIEPSPAFVADTRAKIAQHAGAHPRPTRRPSMWFRLTPLRRAAILAAAVIAFLLVGTAYAQSAAPGDTIYAWKLASESVIRVFDPVPADMWISQRRAREVLAVRHDPTRLAIAWAQYRLVMDRLLTYDGPPADQRIAATLRGEWEQFVLYGVPLPQGNANFPLPTATATISPIAPPVPLTPLPTLPLATSTPTSGPTPTRGPTSTPFVLPTFPPPPPLPTLRPPPTIPPFPCPFPLPICP